MQLAQLGILGTRVSAPIPTDKTVTYAVDATFDETRYYLCATLSQSPKVRSIIISCFTDGVHHVLDAAKKVSFKKSTNLGVTYGAKTLLYDPTDGIFQVQSKSDGYSNNGRFHCLMSCHTAVGSTGGTNELRYVYSDDDGTTVSTAVTIALPANGLNGFRMHDKIMDCGNGVMWAPAYFTTDEGDATQSSRYVVRTTDGGANWSFVLVDGPTAAYINEGSGLIITQNIQVILARYDAIFQFYMYKTFDAGATWSIVGPFSTTHVMTVAAPCVLRKFRSDTGKYYAIMIFPDKGNERLYALYGRLDNGVDAGVGLLNTNTLILLHQDTQILHYGDMCFYNNNMNARGVWPRENGTFPTDNELIYIESPATQYDSVAPYIDPITIYDKLGVLMLVTSSRGLVSNTTNEYGVVNGSNQITTLKSLLPGPINQDFTATAGGIVLTGGRMVFDGTKALSHATAAYFKPLHYSSAGITDIQNTIYAIISPSSTGTYGIFGNNGASASNRGYCLYISSNGVGCLISRAVAGFTIQFLTGSLFSSGVLALLCIEVDLAQASNDDKIKLYKNNVFQSTTVTAFNGTISSLDPTFVGQIGAIGNSLSRFTGDIVDVVIQNHVDLPSVRTNASQALMDVNGIV